MKTWKKALALVLALSMVIPGVYLGGNGSKEVQASTGTESVNGVVLPANQVNKDGAVPTPNDEAYKGWLFAGWFKNSNCTLDDVPESEDEKLFAKFVPADVLSVKAQSTQEIVTEVKDEKDQSLKGKYVLRFVSSVDSLDYKQVGFELVGGEFKKPVYNKTNTVYQKIDSTIREVNYEYSPKVMDPKSEYFITAKLGVADTSTNYIVRAFWDTLDGTRVYGTGRMVSVDDALEGAGTVNLTFELEDTVSASELQIKGYSATFEVIGTTVYAKVTVDRNTLESATNFELQKGTETIASTIYRNLSTTYTTPEKKADTTWYDVYEAAGATEFTIATSADLYGFIDRAEKLAGNTVYLVADITVNTGSASDWKTTPAPYPWTPISSFAGTFDGQGHKISGIYLNETTATRGLFANVDNGAVIRNFSLTETYIYSTQDNVGSIAGRANGGTFEHIYSDAIIEVNGGHNVGGLVGRVQGTSDAKASFAVDNCWFAGSVSNLASDKNNFGGLVGRIFAADTISSVKITNCLNSGPMAAEIHNGPNMGGIYGYSGYSAMVVSNCLNVGTITYKSGATGYGLIGGNKTGTISNTYATSQDGVQFIYGVDDAVHTTDATSANGADALMKMPDLFKYRNEEGNYESYWAIVPGGTPILESFATLTDTECKAIDLSWYSEDADVYTLTDASDLYGFALLTYGNSFEGKTIRLGADIIFNDGDAKSWTQTKAPDYQWITIGADNVTNASNVKGSIFKGTFDGKDPETGKIYSISGLYLNGADIQRKGFFGEVASPAVLKNFKLVNSYLYSRHHNLGSIAGRAYGGTFENIYSDAIVASGGNDYIGGLIGTVMTNYKVTMSNCWFAGTVSGASNGEYIGGLIANAYAVDMSNCLNSGKVISTSTIATPVVGGLIGTIGAGGATIKNSLSTADVSINTPATDGYGLLVGTATGPTEINSTYATKCETCEVLAPDGVTLISSQAVNKTEIYGADALTKIPNIFLYKNANGEYESYWAIVPSGTPILASMADTNTEKSLLIDTSWFGDKTEYTLKDASALYGFALLSKQAENQGFANITIKLDDNIVIPNTGEANGWKTTAPEYAWIGIGNGTTVKFSGTFNGQGHSISGIYVNESTKERKGLFECLDVGADIKNFALLNSYFYTAKGHLASVAGGSYGGTLDTIYSDAIVECGNNAIIISGMIGRIQGETTINNCWFNGSVTNTGTGTSTSGFVGKADTRTTITNCLNSGTITSIGTSDPYVGGFIGFANHVDMYIQNSLNVGQIVVQNAEKDFGLIIGRFGGYAANKTKITNTYTIEQDGVGYVYSSAGIVTEAALTFAKETIYGTAAMDKMPALFTPATADGIIYWAVTEKTPVLASFTEYATDAEGNAVSTIALDTGWYDKSQSTYTLYDADDFYGFAMLSKLPEVDGFKGKTIRLGADIEINQGNAATWDKSAPNYKWIGIGEYIDDSNIIPFKGEFDGNNKTIKGIYYNNTETKYGGLFRLTEGATIKNFSLTNSYVASNRDFLGSIVGQATNSSFEQIYSNAVVAGSRNSIGGLIGRILSSTSLVRCWYDGAVTNTGNSTSNRNTGGLVGRVITSAIVKNCLNTAKVSAPNYTAPENPNSNPADNSVRAHIGGLVGYQDGGTMEISYSLNTGKISYNEAVTIGYGSVVGRANSGVKIEALAAYGTTGSCGKAVDKHASATITPDLELVNIVDAALVGDAAKSTKLFATENAGVWTTVPNAAPVLACFKDKAVAGTAATPTRMQAAIQAGQGSVIEKGTISSSIAFTDQGTVERRQGGCYVVAEDGTTYYYQAFFSLYQGGTFGTGNKDNKVVIVKYEITNGSGREVKRSAELELLYHANDMTYNTKLNLLVVAHANGDMHQVSFIDPDTLEEVGKKWVDGLSYYSIDYNSTYDCYVVQTGAEDGKGHNLVILNGNLEIIKVYENGGLYTDPRKVGASTGQGMACDDKYIYCLFSDSSNTHAITVFDWSGNYVTEISFKLNGEPETLSIVENQILVNVLGESKIYNIEF